MGIVLKLTTEQKAARQPLIDAGNRILTLLYRVSDDATDEQRREAMREHRSFCEIWNRALLEPIEKMGDV